MSYEKKKIGVILTVVGLTLFLIAIGLIWYQNERIIKRIALEKAEIITAQVLADREVYTGQIVHKLEKEGTGANQEAEKKPGFIMLPAQMVRAVAQRVSDDPHLDYSYRLISEWNINPDQGLADPFDIWAWQQLKRQEANFKLKGITPEDRGYPWNPIYRIEKKAGIRTLRYMRADPASAPSCIACHNSWERRPQLINQRKRAGQEVGKQWILHELMGALSVQMPLKRQSQKIGKN